MRKNYTEDVDSFCMKYLRPRHRQAPAADGGTAPDTQAEAVAETKQGTPAPTETQLETPSAPAVMTPPEIPASPGVALQEIPDLDATGDDGVLEKGPDLSLTSPAESPEETSGPGSTRDAGIVGKGPGPVSASPEETSDPGSTKDSGNLGKGPDPTATSPAVVPHGTSNPECWDSGKGF